MIQRTVVAQLELRNDRAKAFVRRAVNQTFEPRINQSAGAHGARLNGCVKNRVRQAIIAADAGRFAQDQNLGVSRRVTSGARAIAGAGKQLPVPDHDRADGHLIQPLRRVGCVQSAAHPEFVGFLPGHKKNAPPSGDETMILGLGYRLVKPRFRKPVANGQENAFRCAATPRLLALPAVNYKRDAAQNRSGGQQQTPG